MLGGIAAALVAELTNIWRYACAAIAVAVVLDMLFALRLRTPEVKRDAPKSMSQRVPTTVRLEFALPDEARPQSLLVYDHHPADIDAPELPLKLKLMPGKTRRVSYRAVANERGSLTFPGCELRLRSLLGFWWRRRFVVAESTVHVYPNYSTISQLLSYEVDNRLQLAGVRLSRRRGEGIEFHQLRDYRDGDGLRAIDWKATSRMGRLISREYQDERDQQVVVLLDAGRRMLTRDGELSHFDYSLNAMLLLCFVALRQGDAAGIMTLGESRSWLPPRKGNDAINGILNHVFQTQPVPMETDYVAAATELAQRQRRRSLVVLLTDVREEDDHDLAIASELLGKRHLLVVASLRDRVLDQNIEQPIEDFAGARLYAATHRYRQARRDAEKRLRARGAIVEDCLGEDLPAAITNRYLAIKRAGLL